MFVKEVKKGQEVIVFENYGRVQTRGIVKEISRWGLELECGRKFAMYDFSHKLSLAVVDSPEYREALCDHRAEKIRDILRSGDAVADPVIQSALETIASALGDAEIERRFRTLIAMGAAHSEAEHIYRNATIKRS